MISGASQERNSARENFFSQARACERLGSKYYGRFLHVLGENISDESSIGARILNWPGHPHDDALALRLAGGLHALVRSGAAPELADVFPGGEHEGDENRYWPAAEAAFVSHTPCLDSYLDSPPQTNEVARSVVLLPGFCEVSRLSGLPLAIFEIGASAGCNLLWERYSYDLSGTSIGPTDSGVVISTEWSGDMPKEPFPIVAARRACDQNPIVADDPEQRDRLLSYLWPDQAARIERLEGALDLVAQSGLTVDRADAADWVEAHFSARPGVATVLYHSILWQYLPAGTQARIEGTILSAGADATADAPVAWLRMEPDPDGANAALYLDYWPGGDSRKLAAADYHGRWVDLAPAGQALYF